MVTRRVEKVSTLLKKELSELISNDFSEDYGLISVMDIDVTSDFKNAKVFISIFDSANEEKILKKLDERTRSYQRILGDRLRMKFTPHLTFKTDQYQEKIDLVDKLLKEIDHGS